MCPFSSSLLHSSLPAHRCIPLITSRLFLLLLLLRLLLFILISRRRLQKANIAGKPVRIDAVLRCDSAEWRRREGGAFHLQQDLRLLWCWNTSGIKVAECFQCYIHVCFCRISLSKEQWGLFLCFLTIKVAKIKKFADEILNNCSAKCKFWIT